MAAPKENKNAEAKIKRIRLKSIRKEGVRDFCQPIVYSKFYLN